MKRFKFAAAAALLVVVGVVAHRLLISIAYSRPEISVSKVGGVWETVTTRSLGGTSWGHTSLYRLGVADRELVAELADGVTYIGGNCVVYSAPADLGGPACWVACGENSPVAIIANWCIRWDTEDGKFRHWVQPPTGPEVVEDIPFEKLIELGSAPR